MNISISVHGVETLEDINNALKFNLVKHIETDLRQIPGTNVIGLYHGTSEQCRNGKVGEVMTVLYDQNNLLTLESLHLQAQSMRICGHIKTDESYVEMLHLYKNRYLTEYPDLTDKLSFYTRKMKVAKVFRSILPNPYITWNLCELNYGEVKPTHRDSVFSSHEASDLNKAARLGFSQIFIGTVKTRQRVDVVREYMEKTGKNYFKEVYLVTDNPEIVQDALTNNGRSIETFFMPMPSLT
jgi:hypothetical protein